MSRRIERIKGVAMAIAGLALIAASRLLIAPGGGLDNAPAKRKRPDAGKRKAAKRARKAAKNLVMYKTAGKRPWVPYRTPKLLQKTFGIYRMETGDPLKFGRSCDAVFWNCRMRSIREDSGFKQMSTIAGYFQTHDVTDVLNCGHCGGRGTWKDEGKGPTMCLRCKGKGRVIFCKPQWIKYVPSADRYEREMRLREQVAGLYMEEAERPE